MDLQYQNKKINYIILCFSIVIGSSFISIIKIKIFKILLTCLICYVVVNFLRKRKQGKLGKCNHFIIEFIIIVSFALNQLLGNFTNIYNLHEFNITELGIALFCVISEGILLFKE